VSIAVAVDRYWFRRSGNCERRNQYTMDGRNAEAGSL
jgi:hypothetical protein